MSQSRDTEFGEYVAARWTRLVRAAVLLGCSPHEAEDVTQAALTRCLVKWSAIRRADDRDAYVYRILVNTFTDSRRRRWTSEKPTDELPEPASTEQRSATDEVGERDAIDRALANLTVDQRTVVVLRYYLNQSEIQMAATLKVAPGTVKSRLARALKAMAVDPELGDDPSAPSRTTTEGGHR